MKIRRLVTAFLTLLLVLSSLSFACPSAKAEGDWSNGGLSYSFAGGVLTISASPDVPDGKNWMHDFDSESRPPWEVDRDAIKTIRITNGVRNIGEYAFTGYKNLTTVVMDADSVTAVGPDAFKGCKKLKTVQFSENLETICSYAFDRCAKLTSVTLPASLQKIESTAFAHCGLTSVNVPKGSRKTPGISSIRGIRIRYSCIISAFPRMCGMSATVPLRIIRFRMTPRNVSSHRERPSSARKPLRGPASAMSGFRRTRPGSVPGLSPAVTCSLFIFPGAARSSAITRFRKARRSSPSVPRTS